MEKLLKQESVSLKKYKSSIYYGNFKEGKKDGMGIMIYQNGRLFEGIFENDIRTSGMERSDNNTYYIGKFVNGTKEGPNGLYIDNNIV